MYSRNLVKAVAFVERNIVRVVPLVAIGAVLRSASAA